jgi:hypothetical protein
MRQTRFIRGACVTLLILLNACTLIQKTAELPLIAVRSIPFGNDSKTYDPVSLQETLLRFADNYINSVSTATDVLKRNGIPVDREFQVLAKVRLTSDMVALVTGSNSLNNLISTLIYTQSLRRSIEDYWRPVHFGDSVGLMAKVLAERGRELEDYAAQILTPQQLNELHGVIETWHKSHPSTERSIGELANIAIVNQIVKAGEQTRQGDESHSSVFALLDLDPLATLDPATRELAETRLFGERTLFLTQRLPQLMEWQMELLSIRSSRIPAVASAVESAQGISTASERFSTTFANIPEILHREQEAFMNRLKEQQVGLDLLAKDTSTAFSEGSRMADATREVLNTYRSLIEEMDRQTQAHPEQAPFRVTDWGQSAQQIGMMSESLQNLLAQLSRNGDASALHQITSSTEAASQRIIRYALWHALVFLIAAVLVIAFAVVGSLLAYERLRLKRRD